MSHCCCRKEYLTSYFIGTHMHARLPQTPSRLFVVAGLMCVWFFSLPSAIGQLRPSTLPSSIALKISVDSPSPQWRVRVSYHEDTIASTALSRDTTILLRGAPSYYINIYRNDTNLWANYYINPVAVNCTSALITCTDRGISISDPRIHAYSRAVQSITDTIPHVLRQARDTPIDVAISNLKEVLDVRHSPAPSFSMSGTVPTSIDQSAYTAVRQFLSTLQMRLNNPAARYASGALLRDQHLSAEAYVIARTMAVGIAQSITRDSRDSGRWERTRSLLADYCPCEVAYSFISRSFWDPCVDFRTCYQELARSIDSLASRNVGYYCRETQRELSEVCSTLNGRVIHDFTAMDRYGALQRRAFSPDSTYVLHFWGTWCQPCIQEYDVTMRVSDSLSAQGMHVIHVAYEPPSRTERWRAFVGNAAAEHLLVHSNTDPATSILRALHLTSYPSFVVIGKGNREVLPRPLSAASLSGLRLNPASR
jgi:thiol-disulfide isomerase/thioredoxin